MPSKLRVIPPEYVPQVWAAVEPWLASALEYSRGDYTVEHAQVYLSSGQWMLVVAEDEESKLKGAAAVQFFNRPASRVAFVVATGGKFVSGPEVFEQLSHICKQYGATHIEGAGRESIARLWSRFGFEEKYRIFEVKL